MKMSHEGKNVEVFWSVNTPGLYYIIDKNKISQEQFDELKFADLGDLLKEISLT